MLKQIKTYYRFVSRYKRSFVFFLVVLILAYTAEAVQPYFYKLLVDAIPQNDTGLLTKIIAFYIGLRIITNWFFIATYWLGDTVLIPLARDVKLRVFQKIQDLDFAFIYLKALAL